jgi:hypothetical protein
MRLDRAARNAGEAFAFVEPDEPSRVSSRRISGFSGLIWIFVGLAAATAIYLGF